MKKQVQAFQWTGDENQTDDPVWIVNAIQAGSVSIGRKYKKIWIEIKKGNLKMIGYPGNYVVRHKNGDISCMSKTCFEKFYELI